MLIVGGGPVGLTAPILLSREGVPSLLVERHPASGSYKRRSVRLGRRVATKSC